jgi:hypothetical protein
MLALKMGSGKVMAFDFQTKKWSEFAHTGFGLWTPSPDGKYLYSDRVTNDAKGPKVFRLRIADRKIETVLDLKGLRRVEDEQFSGVNVSTWVGVTPDGSVLVTRDVGTQEIYSLNVKLP